MTNQAPADWLGLDAPLAEVVRQGSDRVLNGYRADPDRIAEDVGKEEGLRYGGYGKRQVLELVQNGADQLRDFHGGEIRVVLTSEALYCANQGAPIDERGIRAILHANVSPKRDDEIGRFGLGFKSVLGVSSTPQFFSRVVSFGFDAEWAAQEISEVAPGHPAYPVLRLAKVLDPAEWAEQDPVLAELMGDATTVVRVPKNAGESTWLSDDLLAPDPVRGTTGFPAEFLIFSPHVGTVTLEDRQSGLLRGIRAESDDEDAAVVTVTEDGVPSRRWKVFRKYAEPSALARQDAGELADRDRLPVAWAVPVEGRLEEGTFWAFFPLQHKTTLSGIANAPWKVNDDRVGLLHDSVLNVELLDALAELVLSALPDLVKEEDPGWVLDLLPARGREPRSWGDEVITPRVFQLSESYAVLPDQGGTLRAASQMNLAPQVSVPAATTWSEQSDRPVDWCHPSVHSTTTRYNRAQRLLEVVNRAESSMEGWLRSLIRTHLTDAKRSAAAVRVAARVVEGTEEDDRSVSEVRRSKVLLTDRELLVPLDPASVFLPSRDREPTGAVQLVHGDLSSHDDTAQALLDLGFSEITAERELQATLQQELVRWGDDAWRRLWELVREMPTPETAASEILASDRTQLLKVMTRAGEFVRIAEVLLPGPIVGEVGRDDEVVIDDRFHEKDLEVLRHIGVDSEPKQGFPVDADEVFARYRAECVEDYRETVQASSKPDPDLLTFGRARMVGPLVPYERLSDLGRAAFTKALLGRVDEWGEWKLAHRTQEKYQPKAYLSPYAWAIWKYGLFTTQSGLVRQDDLAGPKLSGLSELLAVADDLSDRECELLGVPNALDDLDDSWWSWMLSSIDRSRNDEFIGQFYALVAARGLHAPDEIHVRVGNAHEFRTPAEVVATSSQRVYRHLRGQGEPVVVVPSQADTESLAAQWGLQPDEAVDQAAVYAESGARSSILDAFPTLRDDFRDRNRGDLELVPCSELQLESLTESGTKSESVDFWLQGDEILYDESIGTEPLLAHLVEEFDLDLSEEEKTKLVERTWEDERRRELAAIRELPSDEGRLLRAVGPEVLRKHLPIGLVPTVESLRGVVNDEQIARMFLTVHRYGALKTLQDEFVSLGFSPPKRWDGTKEARRFVEDLGFDPEFAGSRTSQREPTRIVPGPSDLPQLHPYQQEMVEEIHELLRSDVSDRRGMLSLPTGAGKTRIAVEAIVDGLRSGLVESPVLWIAQSDELCEQAVEAWSDVWRAVGPGAALTVSRLWASNEAGAADTDYQVVVATPDKLRARTTSPEYEWLQQSSVVVVDEAHRAISPEYTRILEWQGISQRGGTTKTRAPLIGLTATPFRNTSESETKRLIQRFGKLRLDKEMGDQPYEELQNQRILARVERRALDGMKIQLNSADEHEIDTLRRVPRAIEHRIAGNELRNQQIMESIMSLDSEWPVLVFAVSTDHARTLAALLSLEGLPAAPIDHTTDMAVRRRLVEDFRSGDIRVLTNYNVLSQGFDAPKTRAIYITRPTFSPNQYQQMIGRGLRGPLNGGEAECLIVDVVDNWSRFDDKLAFREFEHLWERRSANGG